MLMRYYLIYFLINVVGGRRIEGSRVSIMIMLCLIMILLVCDLRIELKYL